MQYTSIEILSESLKEMIKNIEKNNINEKSNIKLRNETIKKAIKLSYIINENKLENVKRSEEQAGIEAIYDYIEDNKKQDIESIYVILKIHSLLYSKTPYRQFGGSFRNSNAYISDSEVKTSEPNNISKDIYELTRSFEKALKLAKYINDKKTNSLIIEYLQLVLKIKCRLIEIHPFADGNGRTSRAFVNLMLKKINYLPVIIEAKEKNKYIHAMNEAIVNKNSDEINKIYIKKLTKRQK